ncbi:MAG: TniQ family protein [Xenococcaceae cyanobacterium MO_234.B1]|nr:TniQ family protein [Xenococcaceae cyanobacterium MO_234.B1]
MLAKKAQSFLCFNDEVTTRSTSTPQKLLRTPSPYADESLAGYILRLSEKNYYQSPHWILQLAGYRGNRVLQFDRYDNKPTKLNQLTGTDNKLLKSKAFGATTEDNITSYGVYKKATQLCPDCLKESPHARLFWDSKISRVCPIHQCNLINRCPQCQQAIKWSRPGVVKCECGFDFRHAPTTLATDARINFSFYLYGALGRVEYMNAIKAIYIEDNPVFSLTFSCFSRLSSFLGGYIRAYWRHQKCIELSKIVLTEFCMESELLSLEELVFDFFLEWQNNIKKLLQWHENDLKQRSSQSTTISSMVDFLVRFSSYFPVHCPISVLLESYLINFLSRYHFKQTEIIWTNSAKFRSRTFELKEVKYWLPEIAKTWKDLELNLAGLIIASQDVRYLFPSSLCPTRVMILRNPQPQILRLKLNLCLKM